MFLPLGNDFNETKSNDNVVDIVQMHGVELMNGGLGGKKWLC